MGLDTPLPNATHQWPKGCDDQDMYVGRLLAIDLI